MFHGVKRSEVKELTEEEKAKNDGNGAFFRGKILRKHESFTDFAVFFAEM